MGLVSGGVYLLAFAAGPDRAQRRALLQRLLPARAGGLPAGAETSETSGTLRKPPGNLPETYRKPIGKLQK